MNTRVDRIPVDFECCSHALSLFIALTLSIAMVWIDNTEWIYCY